ncbi:MAG: hypothetical protein ACXIT9_04760 [Nitritalea sp.]
MKKCTSKVIAFVQLVMFIGIYQPIVASSDTSSDKNKKELEFCRISQADKCKQVGDTCPGKKICIWKDTGAVVAIVGVVAATVYYVDQTLGDNGSVQ